MRNDSTRSSFSARSCSSPARNCSSLASAAAMRRSARASLRSNGSEVRDLAAFPGGAGTPARYEVRETLRDIGVLPPESAPSPDADAIPRDSGAHQTYMDDMGMTPVNGKHKRSARATRSLAEMAGPEGV